MLAARDFVVGAVFDSMTRFFTQVALFASVRIEKIDEIFLLPSVIGLACQTYARWLELACLTFIAFLSATAQEIAGILWFLVSLP